MLYILMIFKNRETGKNNQRMDRIKLENYRCSYSINWLSTVVVQYNVGMYLYVLDKEWLKGYWWGSFQQADMQLQMGASNFQNLSVQVKKRKATLLRIREAFWTETKWGFLDCNKWCCKEDSNTQTLVLSEVSKDREPEVVCVSVISAREDV